MITISNKLKSHFLRLYQMAFSDDNFDATELKMLYEFANERGVSQEQLQQILINPIQETNLPDSLEEKIDYLYDLALMIWADYKITEDEKNTLTKYCRRFGFLEENIYEMAEYLLDCAQKGLSKEDILNQINE
tara:strand:+ start:228 stop:626 length:399 start_codon:yes stop_codon:yes gene_type:complete